MCLCVMHDLLIIINTYVVYGVLMDTYDRLNKHMNGNTAPDKSISLK